MEAVAQLGGGSNPDSNSPHVCSVFLADPEPAIGSALYGISNPLVYECVSAWVIRMWPLTLQWPTKTEYLDKCSPSSK